MSWLSFSGRIGRGRFWLGYVLPVTLLNIALQAVGAIDAVTGTRRVLDPLSGTLPLLNLLLLWPMLAGTVKRLHDRNRSGIWAVAYWVLAILPWMTIGVFMAAVGMHGTKGGSGIGLGMVAFAMLALFVVGGIWMLVELGFLRGTVGPNRFGPDPLNPAMPPPGYWPPQGYGAPPGYGPPPQGYGAPPGYPPPPQPGGYPSPPPGGQWGQPGTGPWNTPPPGPR